MRSGEDELVEQMLVLPKEYYYVRLLKTVPIGKGLQWYEDNISDYIKVDRVYE